MRVVKVMKPHLALRARTLCRVFEIIDTTVVVAHGAKWKIMTFTTFTTCGIQDKPGSAGGGIR